MNSTGLCSRARLIIKGEQKISRYQTNNLLKTWFLFLVSMKEQKRKKCEFVTKFVRIVVTIIFMPVIFLECHKSAHRKNTKFTFFIIKKCIIFLMHVKYLRRLVSLCEIVSINFQEHFRNRSSIIFFFLVVSIERAH